MLAINHRLIPVQTWLITLSLSLTSNPGWSSNGHLLPPSLKQAAQSWATNIELQQQQAQRFAEQHGLKRSIKRQAFIAELYRLDDTQHPEYRVTLNSQAATAIGKPLLTLNTQLWLNQRQPLIGIWDGGTVDHGDAEFSGRVNLQDPNNYSAHATHVAGTIAAQGLNPLAKGITPNARLHSYDWGQDISEMLNAAHQGLRLSNHAYGPGLGWHHNLRGDGLWAWFGNLAVSDYEDYRFGFYSSHAQQLDQISYYYPNYLIVQAAGNDRADSPNFQPVIHWELGPSGWRYASSLRAPDGAYDSLTDYASAKNILTIGAVDDLPSGYQNQANVISSPFSNWGPTDDGRIKPDIVTNGSDVLSTVGAGFYASYSGTSMATGSATGALALLDEHYQQRHHHGLRAASRKALVLHTAHEAGDHPGPDYRFGWGLLSLDQAIEFIDNSGISHHVIERSLSSGQNQQFKIQALGNQPLKATLVWTDPEGTPSAATVDPTALKLVNDLDMRITGSGTVLPWTLNPFSPASAAQTGDNYRDPVEQIEIHAPVAGEVYTLNVGHKGIIQRGQQPYSLVISGGYLQSANLTEALDNGFTWQQSGDGQWFLQTQTFYRDYDAAESPALQDNEHAIISTTVQEDGKLSFHWKSDTDNGDKLELWINGTPRQQISGQTAWQWVEIALEQNVNLIEWRYQKDGISNTGPDRVWLDNVRFNSNTLWLPIRTPQGKMVVLPL